MATTEEEISDLKAKIVGYVYSMKRREDFVTSSLRAECLIVIFECLFIMPNNMKYMKWKKNCTISYTAKYILVKDVSH